jgi:hypothetical protein
METRPKSYPQISGNRNLVRTLSFFPLPPPRSVPLPLFPTMASLSSKKQRKEKSSTKSHKERGGKGSKEAITLDEVRKLGNELLSSRAHLNNLPVLLSIISPSPRSLESSLEAMISLQSFFVPLLLEMKSTGDDEDPETVFKSWLKERFNEFMGLLIEVAVSSETDETLKVRTFLSALLLWRI